MSSAVVALSVAVLLFSSLVLLRVGQVSGQSCISSAASSGTSYFHLAVTFVGVDGTDTQGLTVAFSLLLGATFQSGNTTTSADAQYLLTNVSGTLTRSDVTSPISISGVAAVDAFEFNDNVLTPFAATQVDNNGISITDSQQETYNVYLDGVSFNYYDLLGTNLNGYCESPVTDVLITNTSCPMSSSTSLSSSTLSSSAFPSSSSVLSVSSSSGNGAAYSDPYFSGF